MVTCDDEFVAAEKAFIKKQNKAGKPWFVWLNTTHMHAFTHTKPKSRGQAARWQSNYHAATFKDFPAVQKPNSFTVDDAMAKMSEAGGVG